MSDKGKASHAAAEAPGGGDQILFWGCFIALITTAFGFVGRLFLLGTWAGEFNLDPAETGRLAGIGIWPFAVSIIGFSLIIDRIGYKAAMFFAFAGHITWVIMGVSAYYVSQGGDKTTAYSLLYWGSLILGLANGTVEAFINPVVATMFNREKGKWLNILHAGWPAGLVVAGMATIFVDHVPWVYKIGMLGLPAVAYVVILASRAFPVQEREAAGVSYRDMLAELGVLGAAVVGFLVTLQLMDFFAFAPALKPLWIVIGVGIVAGFGVYTRALGNPLLFFLALIMMPLATTEIGTDGWIEDILKGVAKEAGFHAGWVLVYTSAIMMVLRFFAGPIIHTLSPLGLLTGSSVLAIAGLYLLSSAEGLAMIFGAATLYAFGKTFFWPTMLGVASEQTPKGGALTLNTLGGIGMLAVGTLGFPYIGTLQADKQIAAVAATPAAAKIPGLVSGGTLSTLEERRIYEIIPYKVIDDAKLGAEVAKLPAEEAAEANGQFKKARERSTQGALANMAIFPAIMLVAYLVLIGYFQSKGGYKPIHLDGSSSAH
jgi:MFS family permease